MLYRHRPSRKHFKLFTLLSLLSQPVLSMIQRARSFDGWLLLFLLLLTGDWKDDAGDESFGESQDFSPSPQYPGLLHSEASERVGFEVVTLDGRRGTLASSTVLSAESFRWPSVGKYKVDVVSFESLALPELQVKEGTDLFIIDEVGKMELFSSSFFPAVLKILESNIPILASIPIPKFGRDIPGVARLRNHPGAAVFTLNTGNRDAIKENIYNLLVTLLSKH